MTRYGQRPSREPAAELASNGQAIGIAGLFASLIVGALLWLIFEGFLKDILNEAGERATDPTVQNGNQWMLDLVNQMPLIFAGISFFGLIVLAVYQSSLA